jgi:small subunit ribosomal protein S2
LIVPCNNKGRKSLALIFYLLTRELLVGWGKIKSYDEFQSTVQDFEEFSEEKEKDVVSVKPTIQ